MATWYYYKHGGKYGPATDEEMKSLVEQGEIGGNTLVWNDTLPDMNNMGSWVSFADIAPPGTIGAGPLVGDSAVRWYYEASGGRKGPVDLWTMRQLLNDGGVTGNTLVWNEAFGSTWRPLRDTELNQHQSSGPPPLPAANVNNVFAWVLAFLPIGFYIVEKILKDTAPQINTDSLGFLMLIWGVNTGFSLLDSQIIKRSGNNPKSLDISIWCWIVPVYLYKRARLLSHSLLYFWTWLATFVISIVLSAPNLFSSDTYWGTGVPPCGSSFATNQVRTIFQNIPLVRAAGLQATAVSGQTDLGSSETVRTCSATVTTTTGASLRVLYTLTKTNDQIYTELNLAP